MNGQPIITYTAAWNPLDGDVTVLQHVYAGVDGPLFTEPATSKDAASRVLYTNGYLMDGGWGEADHSGNHWVKITKIA